MGLWSSDKGSYRLLNKHVLYLLNGERFCTDLVQNYLEVSGGFCTDFSNFSLVCLSEAMYHILKLWILCLHFYATNIHYKNQ